MHLLKFRAKMNGGLACPTPNVMETTNIDGSCTNEPRAGFYASQQTPTRRVVQEQSSVCTPHCSGFPCGRVPLRAADTPAPCFPFCGEAFPTNSATKTWVLDCRLLGPPIVPFYPLFFGESSASKIDYRRKSGTLNL